MLTWRHAPRRLGRRFVCASWTTSTSQFAERTIRLLIEPSMWGPVRMELHDRTLELVDHA